MSQPPQIPANVPGAPEQVETRKAEERFRPDPAQAAKKEITGEITKENNPANGAPATAFGITRETRISMNAPQRRLEVPKIPGYHSHWFLEDNIPRAIQAGYEYVLPKEVPTADRSIGGRTLGSTSEDLGGDRISQVGGKDASGRPVALVLMKIREDWYFDDQRIIAERNQAIINQIFRRKKAIAAPGEQPVDAAQRYTKEAVFDMSNGRFRSR